jgi:tetratricopeptide (TPR) repeat protein
MRRLALVGLLCCMSILVGCEAATAEQDEAVASARALVESGDYATAIEELEAVVDAEPGNSEAHFLLGQAYNRLDDLVKAADAFRTVLALDPENAAARHNLGVTYFQLQDPNSAVSEFEAALELDPDDADTHYQLGATYLVLALSEGAPNEELLDKATREFETALANEEGMPEALIGSANVHLQRAEYGDATELLLRALDSLPESPEGHYALALAYAGSGDVELSCQTYSAFLGLDPPANWRNQAEQEMIGLQCN